MAPHRPSAAHRPEQPAAISATRSQRSLDASKPVAANKPRSRRFAAAALQSAKLPTGPELSRLVGEKIRDVDGRQLGRVNSVLVDGDLAQGWIVIGDGRRRYYLPADRVEGGNGGAWTSLQRAQIIDTASVVRQGGLNSTTERLLRSHYASIATDRSHYSDVVARERLVRRERAAQSPSSSA